MKNSNRAHQYINLFLEEEEAAKQRKSKKIQTFRDFVSCRENSGKKMIECLCDFFSHLLLVVCLAPEKVILSNNDREGANVSVFFLSFAVSSSSRNRFTY